MKKKVAQSPSDQQFRTKKPRNTLPPKSQKENQKMLQNNLTCQSDKRIVLPPIHEKKAPLKTQSNEEQKNRKVQSSMEMLQKQKAQDDLQKNLQKITTFFRYKISTLLLIMNKKNYFLKWGTKSETDKKKAKPPLMDEDQIVYKLVKLVGTRSKYRYREKCDFGKSLILKAMNYDMTEVVYKLNNVQENQEEYIDLQDSYYEDEKKSRKDELQSINKEIITFNMDNLVHWKRKKGCQNQKVFIIIGGYPSLRETLLEYGWVENLEKDSLCYDFKWTTKTSDIDFDRILDCQYTNHYKGNGNLSSKQGIAKSLKNMVWYENSDQHIFYPRSFDLNDQQEFEDFIEEFKFNHAEAVLKKFVKNNNLPESVFETLQVQVAIAVLCRKNKDILDKLRDINRDIYPIVSPKEWEVLNDPIIYQKYNSNPQLAINLMNSLSSDMDIKNENLVEYAEQILKILENNCPQQYHLNGYKNIWVVKPAGLSRGRGIRTFQDLEPLLQHVCGKNELQWVVQKYLENSYLIDFKRFDIRQWAIVTSFDPITIWYYKIYQYDAFLRMYDECYIRLCSEEYDKADLNNKFTFMVNNSIQKKCENFSKDETMMTQKEFEQYLIIKEGEDIFTKKIRKQIVQTIIYTIKCVSDTIQPRKNNMELFGYDFMVDSKFNTWLIEVNSSPSMEYSTEVTKKIVKQGLQDAGKLINNHLFNGRKISKDLDVGQWKLVYREPKESYK